MKQSILRLAFLSALAALCVAPVASSQVGGQAPNCKCKGKQFPFVTYHPCLDALYLTSSISNGFCDIGQCNDRVDCHWSVSLYYEIDEDCGGGSGILSDNGDLECGSGTNWEATYDGATVAHVAFVCENCGAAGG